MNYRFWNIASLILLVAGLFVVLPPGMLPGGEKPVLGDSYFVQGLDLQGGVELRIGFANPGEIEDVSQAIQEAETILRRRLSDVGLNEPIIEVHGNNQLIVQFPGLATERVSSVRQLLTRAGRLEFYVQVDEMTRQEYDPPESPEGASWIGEDNPILVQSEPFVTGRRVVSADVRRSQTGGGYEVTMQFDEEGASSMAETTGNNIGNQMVIVLDGEVQSRPVIRDEISNSGVIEGNFGPEEASNLETMLETGSLAGPVEVQSEFSVGPTLGEDSVRRGLYATIGAMVLVILFMILYYFGMGLIASGVLLFNLLLLFSILCIAPATLTLPGIAGIILTVGMAVDASVILFERIHEEAEKDQSPRKTFETGWQKGFWAVFDANITTLIVAIILWNFGGPGPIRGFATTLFLGVLTTLFSVFVTEWGVIRGFVEIGVLKKFRQMDWFSGTDYKFLKKATVSFLFSLLIVAGSIGAFAYGTADNLRIFSIDFTGGEMLAVEFSEPVDVDNVRQTIRGYEVGDETDAFTPYQDAELQTIQTEDLESGDLGTSRLFQVRLKGDLFPNLIEQYVNRDFRDFNPGEDPGFNGPVIREPEPESIQYYRNHQRSAGPVLELQFSENRTVESIRQELESYFYKHSFIRPYAGASISLPDEPQPAEIDNDAEASTFYLHLPGDAGREQARRFVQHDLQTLPDLGDLIPRAPINYLPLYGSQGYQHRFQVNLSGDVPVSDFREEMATIFEENNIDATPYVQAWNVEYGEREEAETASSFVVLSRPGVSEEVNNRFTEEGGIEEMIRERQSSGETEDEEASGFQYELSPGPFRMVSSVGSRVADELRQNAFFALLFSWIAIVFYLAIRFQFAYGIGALIALIHDVIIALGITALLNIILPAAWGVNLDIGISSLAAFLTVIGYSVNDTIVTFDRVREIIRETRNLTFVEVLDRSINLNLSRTVITSITTFCAVFVLFVFTATSGSDLASFAFPIMVGVAAGTYSSMFIACPTLIHAPVIGRPADTMASRL